MEGTVNIELTEEQQRKLYAMQDKIAMAYESGKPSLALAQIHWIDGTAVLSCAVIPYDKAQEIIKIVSPTQVGKVTDRKYKLKRLKLARGS